MPSTRNTAQGKVGWFGLDVLPASMWPQNTFRKRSIHVRKVTGPETKGRGPCGVAKLYIPHTQKPVQFVDPGVFGHS